MCAPHWRIGTPPAAPVSQVPGMIEPGPGKSMEVTASERLVFRCFFRRCPGTWLSLLPGWSDSGDQRTSPGAERSGVPCLRAPGGRAGSGPGVSACRRCGRKARIIPFLARALRPAHSIAPIRTTASGSLQGGARHGPRRCKEKQARKAGATKESILDRHEVCQAPTTGHIQGVFSAGPQGIEARGVGIGFTQRASSLCPRARWKTPRKQLAAGPRAGCISWTASRRHGSCISSPREPEEAG